MTKETFHNRHRAVLGLIGKYKPEEVGILIAGQFYKDVWGSKQCSKHMANLLGLEYGHYNDRGFLWIYCASGEYYMMMTGLHNKDLVKEFKEAIEKDEVNQNAILCPSTKSLRRL